MKILSVDKVREADLFTIRNEPITDIDLMERAASTCVSWLIRNIPPHKKINIFCGTGNNGGDGLAIARLMAARGYRIAVFLTGSPDKFSPSCKINFERLNDVSQVTSSWIEKEDELPVLHTEDDIILDALFGSGLKGPIKGFPAKIIHHINEQKSVTISIDVPSGLSCDETVSGLSGEGIIHADYTLTFSPPKLAFFFPENDIYVGNWQLLDIGISQEYIDRAETKNFYITREDCRKILKPRNRYAHKGDFGHALLICGSLGKMGASVLAAGACLRSGPGLVTVHIPRSGIQILQTAVPEAMLSIDHEEAVFSGMTDLSGFSSIAVGPGIGQADDTQKGVKHLIQNSPVPLIFDADAINILAQNKTWIPFVPKGSIFTPHPKEFERLAGKTSNDFERNQVQRTFSIKYGVYVVLKGAHTAITTPEGNCYFNSTGNPGMATGGSGDVLTGILAGLRAQGYSALETCLLGVYIHGLAGDLAADEKGHEALIAGDIIQHSGNAFLLLYGEY
ncbi:MAG: NAD(P)H-hydrate dehydratase [Bacteroidetes bacterium]|nr:NAD(P)H-hydrate dehydratase [Bacteroidota bacterium]